MDLKAKAVVAPTPMASPNLPRLTTTRRLMFTIAVAVALAIAISSVGNQHAFAAGQWTAVAAGGSHTCGIKTSGAVQCWGANDRGQLGNGTFLPSAIPVDVVGIGSGAQAITAGGFHTCVLLTNGGAKCWGEGDNGQLGDSVGDDSNIPVNVTGLTSGVQSISAGGLQTCASVSGAAKCWGSNSSGQLGDNSTTNRNAPVTVSGLGSGVLAVSSGSLHSCALVAAGAVKCWGGNFSGQLGNGSFTSTDEPVAVTGIATGAQEVNASGNTSCARSAGAVKCWGNNFRGQFGSGNTTDSNIPVAIAALSSGVTALDGGSSHTCSLAGGAMKCSGTNASAQLGNGTTTDTTLPVAQVPAQTGVTAMSAGDNHTCAITDGDLRCWGSNDSGQLGNGFDSRSRLPVDVIGLDVVTSIAAGGDFTCAIVSAAAKCWGGNGSGQVGDGTVVLRSSPTSVSGLSSGVTRIAAGDTHACAVVDGGAKCWGNNLQGQVGLGTPQNNSALPVGVAGLASGVQVIAAGGSHSCAVSSGAAKCWGSNTHGQLGNAGTLNQLSPDEVTGLTSGVTAMAAGRFHTCAIISGGGVNCWGRNDSGQLGNGANGNSNVPVQVTGLTSGVIAIAAGTSHSCAILTSGAVMCWGANLVGQLGDGTNVNANVPVAVPALASGGVAIDAGGDHTCVRRTGSGGLARCWGGNSFAQLGDGTTTNRNAPVSVSTLPGGILQVTAGLRHTCARTASELFCWGSQQAGQLGDGELGYGLSPGEVGIPLDVTGCNGVLNANDALAVLHVLAGLTTAPQPTLPCTGDVNGDQLIDVRDVLHIRNLVAGLNPP